MKLNSIYHIIESDTPIHTFIKNGYEYKVYCDNDIISIHKEDLKTEYFEIKSYEIK
jgi:hypothetical protein